MRSAPRGSRMTGGGPTARCRRASPSTRSSHSGASAAERVSRAAAVRGADDAAAVTIEIDEFRPPFLPLVSTPLPRRVPERADNVRPLRRSRLRSMPVAGRRRRAPRSTLTRGLAIEPARQERTRRFAVDVRCECPENTSVGNSGRRRRF